MEDIDSWEGKLLEYYKCGGDQRPHVRQDDNHRVPPHAAAQHPSSLKMALKDLRDFEQVKDESAATFKYLQDFGGLASAHMVGTDEQAELAGAATAPSKGGARGRSQSQSKPVADWGQLEAGPEAGSNFQE